MTEKASWSKLPERGSIWGIRSVLWTLNLLGYTVASLVLIPIVAYFFLTGKKSRRASLDYLRRLQRLQPKAPGATLWQAYRHHLEFAQTMLERLLLWQGKLDRFEFKTVNKELLEKKGVGGSILFGAHFGSFDALRVLALPLKNRVHLVMFRSHAKQINRVIEELSPDANLRVVEIVPGDINGVLDLKACIDRGEHVAILADRHAPGAKERVCQVPFLGENAAFPQSPWILASLLECPVLLITGVRTSKRSYRVSAEHLFDRVVLERKNRQDTLQPYVAAFAKRLEELCCEYPRQWFNFYDFWNSHE